jgi:hypothetical protein
MQNTRLHYVVLLGLFMLALGVRVALEAPDTELPPRSPDAAEELFTIEGWASGPLQTESLNHILYVTRDYHNVQTGMDATLAIATAPEAKRIYRAGAEVPFLGNGYSVGGVDPAVLPRNSSRNALLGQRGDELLLQIFAYGERRGLLGNSGLAWGMALFDGALGRDNDYFLARVMARMSTSTDAAVAQSAAQLADVLFPRLAAWYAHN